MHASRQSHLMLQSVVIDGCYARFMLLPTCGNRLIWLAFLLYFLVQLPFWFQQTNSKSYHSAFRNLSKSELFPGNFSNPGQAPTHFRCKINYAWSSDGSAMAGLGSYQSSKRPPHPHITVTIITIITTTTTALLEQRTSKAMPYKVSNLSPVMIPPRTPTLDLVKRVSSTSNYQMLLPPVSHVQVQCASTLIYLLNFFNFFH